MDLVQDFSSTSLTMAEPDGSNKKTCEKSVVESSQTTKQDHTTVSHSPAENTMKYKEELLTPPEMNKVGQSVFYDCIDMSPTAEKQDDMKPERSDTEEESSCNLKKRKLRETYIFLIYFVFFSFFIQNSVRYRSGLYNFLRCHIFRFSYNKCTEI